MNYKRRKPKTKVKCSLCTPYRLGNSLKVAKRSRLVAEQKFDFERREADVFR